MVGANQNKGRTEAKTEREKRGEEGEKNGWELSSYSHENIADHGSSGLGQTKRKRGNSGGKKRPFFTGQGKNCLTKNGEDPEEDIQAYRAD